MARNLTGTYSLPAGINPVVAGTTITDTWGNQTMNDVATALTDSLSRSGKGGMTAPLQFSDGAAAAPAITFATETTSGLYKYAAGELRISVLGTDVVSLSTALATFNVPVYGPTATAGTSNTQLATTAFVAGQAFSTALPGISAPTAGMYVTNDGTVASWAPVGQTVSVVSGTTQSAVAGNHYILTNVAASTVTLPASPASGDMVWVTWTNSLATNVIARNGQPIMGLAEDMNLNVSTNGTVQLRFVSSSWRIL